MCLSLNKSEVLLPQIKSIFVIFKVRLDNEVVIIWFKSKTEIMTTFLSTHVTNIALVRGNQTSDLCNKMVLFVYFSIIDLDFCSNTSCVFN